MLDTKANLRQQLLAARRARTRQALDDARGRIRAAVLARAAAQGWRTVAAYVPMATEPGSVELLDGLRADGISVIVPVVLADLDLSWTPWGADPVDLGPDAIGEADAVLVPALAVAPDGTRLGRGGGCYDRALTRVRAGSAVAAVLFEDEMVGALPREEWDQPVSAVVTPDGWQDLLTNFG